MLAYLLVPGILFKFFFSFFIPLEKFQRTRSEELTFGAFTTTLPLALALVLVLNASWFGNHPFCFQDSQLQKQSHYRAAASSLYSENYFSQHEQAFWDASARVFRRQGRILVWLYIFTTLEANLFGWFGRNYGQFRKSKAFAVITEKLLIPNISSWHVLLTTFLWPKKPERKVVADLLTSDDHLYRGRVAGYEVGRDGALRGILLTEASRFDRRSYLKAKDSAGDAKKENYWKQIPGKNLFIFADKLSTMNLSYLPPPSSFPDVLERILRRLNIEATVTVQPSESSLPTE